MKSIIGNINEEGFIRTRLRRNEKEGKDGRETAEPMETETVVLSFFFVSLHFCPCFFSLIFVSFLSENTEPLA